LVAVLAFVNRPLTICRRSWFLTKEEDKLDALKNSTFIGEAAAAPFVVDC
jgi:hypothetical protein